MGGYQYSILHTIPVTDASAIWLKGDDECPNRDATLADGIVSTSSELRSLQSKTLSFYQSFADIFEGVLPKSELSFKNAYAIFDYINVGSVHNSTISKRITSDELFQLRTLADASESAINGKQEGSATPASDIKALSGRTLAKKILAQLDSTVAAKGSKNKFNLLVGSYDSFLSFFNLAFLAKASTNFTGLPNYAGSMAFELFTNVSPSSNKGYPAEDDLNVRFLFRNGSEVDTTTNEYPLFGRAADNAVMSYTDFKKLMGEIAIPDVESWCDVCDSEQSFCKALKVADKAESSSKSKDQTMSNAVAGVIGAFVTLGAILLLTAASFLLFGLTFGRKHTSAAAVNFAPKQIESEKSSVV
ncbi:histidine phosphatase superfamily [Peziza echinospora]|nr:histidine phosphatase superfamily [Peziza echinospora]